MIYTRGTDGEVAVLNIAGELDAVSVPELRPALDELVSERRAKIVVDLAHLRLIDSSGIGALVFLFRSVREQGGRVVVRGAKEQPLAILRLLKLDQILQQEAA
jgi:anti-sigma B factor antagonist